MYQTCLGKYHYHSYPWPYLHGDFSTRKGQMTTNDETNDDINDDINTLTKIQKYTYKNTLTTSSPLQRLHHTIKWGVVIPYSDRLFSSSTRGMAGCDGGWRMCTAWTDIRVSKHILAAIPGTIVSTIVSIIINHCLRLISPTLTFSFTQPTVASASGSA